MKRRALLIWGASAAALAPAQVTDLNDAINKAGRQRMLSQRMGKAYLALAQNIEPQAAQQVLDKSMALFDRQLVELRAFAPNAELRDTYGKLDTAWGDYKQALVGTAANKAGAASVLALDGRVLALANEGTSQYEAASGKPAAKLVNLAGRQRMLSQRMAKYYFASGLRLEPGVAAAELAKAKTDFLAAMEVLRSAPQATPKILDALALADGQWVFFDQALQKAQSGSAAAKLSSDVFVASENILAVMDQVTGLFSALKG